MSKLEDDFLDENIRDLPKDTAQARSQRMTHDRACVEAVIFASAKPVSREVLQKVVGQGADIDLLIEDIQGELKARPYEIVFAAGGWMFRTRSRYAPAIRAAADLGEKEHGFSEEEMAVLCAIAYHQPIDRAGLAEIFGKEISRDLLSRLRFMKLIGNGPRSPRPGAPHTFVTTGEFLEMFDLQSLRDLPEMESMENVAG